MNSQKIIDAIRANNNANLTSGAFVPFQTDTTIGYVPTQLYSFFLDTGDFEFDGHTLRFAEGLDSFESKSDAMKTAQNLMVESGAINKKPAHYAQEWRAIGNESRLCESEFIIDRAYDYVFGFQVDAVSLQTRTVIDGQTYFLLQRRGQNVVASGKLDSTASGAVKYPERNFTEAIKNQLDHEVGSQFKFLAEKAVNLSSLSLALSLTKSSNGEPIHATQRIRKELYEIELNEQTAMQIIESSTEEAESFFLATPDDIINYCIDETIPPVLVQSFMASLFSTNLMPNPETNFTQDIKNALTAEQRCLFKNKEIKMMTSPHRSRSL
jgi:hypothetical protein